MKIFDSPDKPPVVFISVVIFATFLFVFACWFVSRAFLTQFTDSKQAKMETGMGNAARIFYIEKETNYLNSDTSLNNGDRKISIEEAMKKLIEKENK